MLRFTSSRVDDFKFRSKFSGFLFTSVPVFVSVPMLIPFKFEFSTFTVLFFDSAMMWLAEFLYVESISAYLIFISSFSPEPVLRYISVIFT